VGIGSSQFLFWKSIAETDSLRFQFQNQKVRSSSSPKVGTGSLRFRCKNLKMGSVSFVSKLDVEVHVTLDAVICVMQVPTLYAGIGEAGRFPVFRITSRFVEILINSGMLNLDNCLCMLETTLLDHDRFEN